MIGEGIPGVSTLFRSKFLLKHIYLVANFAAYLFAPPILVTPLGALSVLIGCVFVTDNQKLS